MNISMDGKRRYSDNIFVKGLSWTVEYEEAHLKAYSSATEARREPGDYFRFHSDLGPHQALGCRTPAEVFHGDQAAVQNGPRKRGVCRDRRRHHWQKPRGSHLIPPSSCPDNRGHLSD